MRRVLLLGPGAQGASFEVRRQWQILLRQAGHEAHILETTRDSRALDLTAKLQRLLSRAHIDTVVVYWPCKAQMQSVYDEMLLLRNWAEGKQLWDVYVLHHEAVLRVSGGTLHFLEHGRSRYMDSIKMLRPTLLAWKTPAELHVQFDVLQGVL